MNRVGSRPRGGTDTLATRRPEFDVSGVLVPLVTPFDALSGELDIVGIRGNVRALIAVGVRGVVVAGSTGEAVYLDADERRRLIDAVRGVVPDGRLLVAGTGAESTRATIRLTREAAEAGADAVLVMPPAFYRGAMTPHTLLDHYRGVADAAPVPVIVYQVPLRMNTLDLPTGLVAELSGHENVVGIKDSRGDLGIVGELLEQSRRGFQVLVGSGAMLYAALEVGAVGGVLGVANIAPRASADLVRAYQTGRPQEAGRLQEVIGPVHNAVVASLGVAGVKVAVDLLGLQGGDPRPPLRPLSPSKRDKVRRVLEAAHLL